jgi:hypothetical protein
VIQHHPDRPLADFRCKLVRRLAHIGSVYSRVGASGKPGAVQLMSDVYTGFGEPAFLPISAHQRYR